MKKIILFFIAITLIFNLTACNTSDNSVVSLTNFYFDTAITITIYDGSGKKKANTIINDCFGLCKDYEALLSRTLDDSDVSKINKSNGAKTEVNPVVCDIIKDSLKYSKLTSGAFDITIAPLSILWNIDNSTGIVPEKPLINEAISHVNYKNITVNSHSVTLSDNKSQIDLGGIAKGFIADKLKDFMVSSGVTSAIIDLGGNILTIGQKSLDKPFKIGIKKPFSNNVSEYAATIDVSDGSVVTSGIYERYFKQNNKIYHHILDVKTGYPVENNLYSVTIISNDSESGDALSTGVFALGLDNGRKLINSMENTEAVFITNENKIILTDNLNIDKENNITLKSVK